MYETQLTGYTVYFEMVTSGDKVKYPTLYTGILFVLVIMAEV